MTLRPVQTRYKQTGCDSPGQCHREAWYGGCASSVNPLAWACVPARTRSVLLFGFRFAGHLRPLDLVVALHRCPHPAGRLSPCWATSLYRFRRGGVGTSVTGAQDRDAPTAAFADCPDGSPMSDAWLGPGSTFLPLTLSEVFQLTPERFPVDAVLLPFPPLFLRQRGFQIRTIVRSSESQEWTLCR
jgi:hypothetical protein